MFSSNIFGSKVSGVPFVGNAPNGVEETLTRHPIADREKTHPSARRPVQRDRILVLVRLSNAMAVSPPGRVTRD